MPRTAFFAFPSEPPFIGETVKQTIPLIDSTRELIITPWPELEIQGLKLDNLIRDRISAADLLIADITYPNFNVYYEIGFAIGKRKPFIPTINFAVEKATENVNLTGLFDTLGESRYQNAVELSDLLSNNKAEPWTNHYLREKDHTQPLFFLDTLLKTDFRNFIVQSITNSSVKHRSFDPTEVPRLSLTTAVGEISASAGVIIPLISTEILDWQRHNLRAAFLAGMSHAFGIEPLIIQYNDAPAPIDFREFIDTARTRGEIDQSVSEYCQETLIKNQQRADIHDRERKTLLDRIDIGSSSAENEFQKLTRYFVRTAEFARALRAPASIVLGRKGSGKSAIFFQVVEEKARDKRNLILELNPASHNLSELREQLVATETVGLFDHTIAAFWQYILYAEIALKIREHLLPKAKYDLNILKEIKTLEDKFRFTDEMVAGDFTSRLLIAAHSIIRNIHFAEKGRDLKEQLTNILFERQIPQLREAIVSLGAGFEAIVLLLDNLDKGWPTRQVEAHDVKTIRHLIDSLNKIQRDLERRSVNFQYLLFLRSDVYENLVEETADRGKFNVIRVDWSDPAQLEHLIRERVVSNIDSSKAVEAWQAVNPTLNGQSAISKMISSSLMRPRFLIDLCEKTISFAINRGHATVQTEDVKAALRQQPLYLVSDFGYEVRDVSGVSEDIFYQFLGEGDTLTPDEVIAIIRRAKSDLPPEQIVELLVWYGFLGIPDARGKPVYIYDRDYDMRRIDAERKKQDSDLLYVVNPAFLLGLQN